MHVSPQNLPLIHEERVNKVLAGSERQRTRGCRMAQHVGVWALGVSCAAMWLALLTASNFNGVAVGLGLLCVLLILR